MRSTSSAPATGDPGEDAELGIKAARQIEKSLRAGLAELPRDRRFVAW